MSSVSPPTFPSNTHTHTHETYNVHVLNSMVRKQSASHTHYSHMLEYKPISLVFPIIMFWHNNY